MNRKLSYAIAWAVTSGFLVAASSNAEVKSLTSEELTDTYVKDSTIIVTPAPKPKQQVTRTFTISPGEPVKTEAEEQADRGNLIAEDWARFEQQAVDAALRNEQAALAAVPSLELAPLNPRVLPHPNLTIPEGAFTFEQLLGQTQTQPVTLPYGQELGFTSDGQELTITIGNLPGVDPYLLQQRIQGGLVDLRPRDEGGFDLTLTIPSD